MYNVQATAKGASNDANAQVIVIIGGQKSDEHAMQTRASAIGGKPNMKSTLSIGTIGTFDEMERIFTRENTSSKKKSDETIDKVFLLAGDNPVMVKGYRNGKLAGISYFTVGIDEGR